MREIKFRAWDKKRELMCYSHKWLQGGNNESLEAKAASYSWPYGVRLDGLVIYRTDMDDHLHGAWWGIDINNLYILLQYTGLKDKNGKEIYEGDIIKDMSGWEGEVLFHLPDGHNNIFGWTIRSWNWDAGSKESWIGINGSRWLEVIGNIYENPELISE